MHIDVFQVEVRVHAQVLTQDCTLHRNDIQALLFFLFLSCKASGKQHLNKSPLKTFCCDTKNFFHILSPQKSNRTDK